jgi:DNA-binding Lrp family transcriptional regulator
VRRRIAELTASGLLYFDADIDDRQFGYHVSALLLLTVEPARLEETGRAMAAHAETPYVAAVTGQCNLIAQVVVRDTQHLYEYVSGRLAMLPGLRSVETLPEIATVKRASSTAAPAPR